MLKELFFLSFLNIKIFKVFKFKNNIILILYSTHKLDKSYLYVWIKNFFKLSIKHYSRIYKKNKYYYKIKLK